MSKNSNREQVDKLFFERQAQANGYKSIAGMDEVGRGPLAGPVCVACVIMPLETEKIIDGVDDSKKLSEKKREALAEQIKERAICFSIAMVDEKTIDKINILEATKLCMKNAVEGMKITPDIVLVDAIKELDTPVKIQGIIKGDALSYSIGCASILAKVTRDAFMTEMAKKYKEYGFEKHKGYGTKAHMDALFKYGMCEIHRKTFCKFLEGK